MDWMRIWTRNTLETRKQDELLELVLLNERLAGSSPVWQARQRLSYLKKQGNWEAIYNYISTVDAVATLELVEEANRKVRERERRRFGCVPSHSLDLSRTQFTLLDSADVVKLEGTCACRPAWGM